MIGILCEKPSAARNFAKALGGMHGTYNGEKYIITCSRGHLYGLIQDPDKQVKKELEEKYKSWRPENLPWDEKELGWKYGIKKDAKETLDKIKEDISDCDEICIATDDDPTGEGELLAWEIIWYQKLKADKYTRMYFADEAPASIQKAFKTRKTLGTDIRCMLDDPDYKQAMFRTKWDYLSMQWTRLACAYGVRGCVPRQGRLKSAMVKIVGDQLDLCQHYVKKPFYQNRFKDENGVVYTNKKETQFETAKEVPHVYEKSPVMLDSKTAKHTVPPKFLDLAALSSLMAGKGIKAKTVLETYQHMYEAQVVSYPRTDDKVITEEQFYELLPLVDKIADVIGADKSLLKHRKPRTTHVKEGGAHGANRPGIHVPASLSELSQYGEGAEEIYALLARNYLATLCEDYEYEQQVGHVQKYPAFIGTANVPGKLGWKSLYSNWNDDESEEENANGIGTMAAPFVFEGANPKPQAPTMKWLMKQLEKYNVGTGATRTSIYADVTNEKSKYPLLTDSKGKLDMAENGQISYALLPGTHIGDLKLTERLMGQMKEVASGKTDADSCLHEIQTLIREDAQTIRENGNKLHGTSFGKNAGYVQKDKFTGTWDGKEVSFNRDWAGHHFSDKECEDLLAGKSIKVVGLKSKSGKKYGVTGHLEQQVYKGQKFIGFKMEDFLK